MNDKQQNIIKSLTWPGALIPGCSHSIETVLSVNGVRVIVYPSGKLDILTVDDSDMARETEAAILTKFNDKLLLHRSTFYARPSDAIKVARNRISGLWAYLKNNKDDDREDLFNKAMELDSLAHQASDIQYNWG